MNFTDPEGHIEIPQLHSSASLPDPEVDCTYVVTVYLGYGIEVQVSENRILSVVPFMGFTSIHFPTSQGFNGNLLSVLMLMEMRGGLLGPGLPIGLGLVLLDTLF